MSWYYWGVHTDPHPRLWVPGMREVKDSQVTDEMIMKATPPPWATPFEVYRLQLTLATKFFAYSWRERWKTQISTEPECAAFITNQTFADDDEAIAAAKHAFPEVWTRFEKLDLSKCRSSRPSSAASPSNTVETADRKSVV